MKQLSTRDAVNIAMDTIRKVYADKDAEIQYEGLYRIDYTTTAAEVLEKLNGMIEAMNRKNEGSREAAKKRTAEHREARDELFARILEVLPTDPDEALNSSEILAKLGNPEGLTPNGVSTAITYHIMDRKVITGKIKGRVVYSLRSAE